MIKAGEILAVESPAVHLIYPDRLMSNCTECFKPVVVPVPCFGCAGVVYCSDKCR